MRIPARSALIAMVLCSAALARPASADLTPPLSVRWVFSLSPDRLTTLEPAVGHGRVYLTHRGVLYCLDERTGAQQWTLEPADATLTTAPLLLENLVIVGADDGSLFALEPTSGAEVWRTTLGGPVRPTPILLDGLLVAGAGTNAHGLDPASGRQRWVCALASAVAHGPVTDGSMLYFLAQDGAVQSVDPDPSDPRFRWRTPLPTGPRVYPPIVADRRVIVAGGRRVIAVARTGAISWNREMPVGVAGRPTLIEDVVYVPSMDGRIYSLYARSGAPRRGPDLALQGAATAAPVATDQVIFAGSSAALVYAFDRESGEPLWIYRCRAPEQFPDEVAPFGIPGPLVVAGDLLLCLTGAGDLYCFSADAPDFSPPRISDFSPEPGEALPARPVQVSCVVVDDGSGVDPASVAVTVNNRPVSVSFDLASGVVSFSLSSPGDASHAIRVTARDYRGNEGTEEWSFLTHSSITAADQPGAATGPASTRGLFPPR